MTEETDATILVIDDSPDVLDILRAALRPQYRVLAARSGEAGIKIAQRSPAPDLILLDVMMPEMDGYSVLGKLRENPLTCTIPVIFLTALAGCEDEERGLEVGAADYIAKPIKPAVLLARVSHQLNAKQTRDWLKNQNAALESEISRRMADNDAAVGVAIRAVAQLAEARGPEIRRHLRRTQRYLEILAEALRKRRDFAVRLTDGYVKQIVRAAPLHDIGKAGIADAVLKKRDALTPEEAAILQTHTTLGADAIERAERNIHRPLEFLAVAKEIARAHHEWWNGAGYPGGLKGEAIPLCARLMAVADAFDAMTAGVDHTPVVPFEAARDRIVAARGTQFDPDVVDAFVARYDDFVDVAEQLSDDG